MSVEPNPETARKPTGDSAFLSAMPPKNYGLAGLGTTSRFEVEIDEAIDKANDLLMSVRTRNWTFRFALSARGEVARMLAFLREHAGRLEFSEMVVGSFHNASVRLVKDDEFGDRFWLRASQDGLMVEFTLAADDLSEFTDAVAQAVEELRS